MGKQAILKTLHYADIFDYPLKVEEIHTYLVEPLKIDVLKEILSQIDADDKQISADSGFHCLPGRESIVELRRKRERWSRPKLERAKRMVGVLKLIPWIKLIGVTGALAMGNSDAGDDIDLMVVTARERLWLTRGLVVTVLLLTGQYRRREKIRDMICPNLMVSEDALEFPDRDLFTAHEIVQMKPIYGRENTYREFINANRWVFDFLPNWKPDPAFVNRKSTIDNRRNNDFRPKVAGFARQFTDYGLRLLEKLAYRLQLKYMKKRKTVEITTPSVIRFHPQDARQRVLDEYQKRVYTLPK